MDRGLKNTGQKYWEKHSKVVCWDIWLWGKGHDKWKQVMWGGPWKWTERNMQQRKSDEGSRDIKGRKGVKDSYICRILLSVGETGLNLKIPDEQELETDYRRENQNFDRLLLIMGLLCTISMWGVVGFIFRDLWKTVESLLESEKPGCNLLFKLLWLQLEALRNFW